jgi:xylulokinase
LSIHSSAHVGAALGAARLALLAANPGLTVAGVCTAPPVLDVVAPDRAWQDALLPRYERFRKLYLRLQGLF